MKLIYVKSNRIDIFKPGVYLNNKLKLVYTKNPEPSFTSCLKATIFTYKEVMLKNKDNLIGNINMSGFPAEIFNCYFVFNNKINIFVVSENEEVNKFLSIKGYILTEEKCERLVNV